MKTIWLLFILVTVAAQNKAQSYSVADLKDFTKSSTEHIIHQIEQPFEVKSVKGAVEFKHGQVEALRGVLFEIEGPGTKRRIRRAYTREDGRFEIRHVPPGAYKFKATLNGFQSVVGTIVVLRKPHSANEIKIEMLIGV